MDMRTSRILWAAVALLCLGACKKQEEEVITPKGPLEISLPKPTQAITKVELTPEQSGYVDGNNRMAMRLLQNLYGGESFLCSPLSLQLALSMTANGASGETQKEITDFLGFGNAGIEALNAYNKSLLEQLPAVDLDVELSLTDALLVNKKYPLQKDYQQTVRDHYYAAVENEDLSDPVQVCARINDWASRNTNGFIDHILDPKDIQADAPAFLMNALYFKAQWAKFMQPLFLEEFTRKEDFTLPGGKVTQVPMMNCNHPLAYAERDGYRVLALPYAGWRYYMYIVLPDDGKLETLAAKLVDTPWKSIIGNLNYDADVEVKLPKFDVEIRYELKETLQALGIRRAFHEDGSAQFDRMLQAPEGVWFYVGEVYQKSRISVAEWGTEAASVTVVAMKDGSGMPSTKRVKFYANRPFFFFIGEATSGTLLFEGAYTGK